MDVSCVQRIRRVLEETSLLVVDDTPVIRGVIEDILDPLGLGRLFQAGDGEEAWAILLDRPVDLVVADWLMPGVDGLELLGRMRESPRHEATPFIMITGAPDRDVVAKAMALNVTDFMLKPINASVLKQKILKALGPRLA